MIARGAASSPFSPSAGSPGHARGIAGGHIGPGAEELRFEYPFTTEIAVEDPRYAPALTAFYEVRGARSRTDWTTARDVALLCEGDPFFYGSAMYLFDRLAGTYPHQVVPGVTGMSGCWAEAELPMTHGNDVLTVLPGTMDEQSLAARLAASDAAVIMKVGRNLPKIRAALPSRGRGPPRRLRRARHDVGQSRTQLRRAGRHSAPYFAWSWSPGGSARDDRRNARNSRARPG